MPIRAEGAIKLVNIEDIECIVLWNKTVLLRCKGLDQRVMYSLNDLEDLLGSEEFMRIHVSVIVCTRRIKSVQYLENHSYAVITDTGLTLPVGRSYRELLMVRMGLRRKTSSDSATTLL